MSMTLKLLDFQGLQTLAEFIKSVKKTADESSSAVSELGVEFQSLAEMLTAALTEIEEQLEEVQKLSESLKEYEERLQKLEEISEILQEYGGKYNTGGMYNL